MRTNIEIDDALMERAMKSSGLATKRATVEEALRQLVCLRLQSDALEQLRGVGWEGDLNSSRRARTLGSLGAVRRERR